LGAGHPSEEKEEGQRKVPDTFSFSRFIFFLVTELPSEVLKKIIMNEKAKK